MSVLGFRKNHKLSEYLQLLHALLHLHCLVSHTPGQTHVEGWIL